MNSAGSACAQPAWTTLAGKGHIDYVFPAVDASTMKASGGRLHVSAIYSGISGLEALVPSGVFFLNSMQEAVYLRALSANSANTLVSAPTSSGKTLLAILAINELVRVQCATRSAVHPFIAVYIAPLKSLVSEIVRKFAEIYEQAQPSSFPYSFRVVEQTGDSSLSYASLSALAKGHNLIIVATAEKYDIVSRNASFLHVLRSRLRLLVIDELHILQDATRGASLEALVVRHRMYYEACRVLGLSATIPNYQELGDWLGCPGSNVFSFGAEYRPLPLEMHIVKTTSDAESMNAMRAARDGVLLSKLASEVLSGRCTLVFVHSRLEAERLAGLVVQSLSAQPSLDGHSSGTAPRALSNAFTEQRESIRAQLRVPGGQAGSERETADNHKLRETLGSNLRIAFHHAGLSREDRHMVEDLMVRGGLLILVSTATLAWGVNTPANTVMIAGTEVYRDGEYTDLPILDVHQMVGRAGRLEFVGDTVHAPGKSMLARAFVLCDRANFGKYLALFSQRYTIDSHLRPHSDPFLFALLSEVQMRRALYYCCSVRDLLGWHEHTLIFFQSSRLSDGPEGHTAHILQDLRSLTEHFRALDADTEDPSALWPEGLGTPVSASVLRTRLVLTSLGDISAAFFISSATIKTFYDRLRGGCTMLPTQLLAIYAESAELQGIRTRPEEETELAAFINRLPIPVPPPLRGTAGEKVLALFQIYVSSYLGSLLRTRGDAVHNVSSLGLIGDISYISGSATRVLVALFRVCLAIAAEQNQPGLNVNTLLLSLRLCTESRRCTWGALYPVRAVLIDAYERGEVPFARLHAYVAVMKRLEGSQVSFETLRARAYDLQTLLSLVRAGGPLAGEAKEDADTTEFLELCAMYPTLSIDGVRVLPLRHNLFRVSLDLLLVWPDHRLYRGMSSLEFWVFYCDSLGTVHRAESVNIRYAELSEGSCTREIVLVVEKSDPYKNWMDMVVVASADMLGLRASASVSFARLCEASAPETKARPEPAPESSDGWAEVECAAGSGRCYSVSGPVDPELFSSRLVSEIACAQPDLDVADQISDTLGPRIALLHGSSLYYAGSGLIISSLVALLSSATFFPRTVFLVTEDVLLGSSISGTLENTCSGTVVRLSYRQFFELMLSIGQGRCCSCTSTDSLFIMPNVADLSVGAHNGHFLECGLALLKLAGNALARAHILLFSPSLYNEADLVSWLEPFLLVNVTGCAAPYIFHSYSEPPKQPLLHCVSAMCVAAAHQQACALPSASLIVVPTTELFLFLTDESSEVTDALRAFLLDEREDAAPSVSLTRHSIDGLPYAAALIVTPASDPETVLHIVPYATLLRCIEQPITELFSLPYSRVDFLDLESSSIPASSLPIMDLLLLASHFSSASSCSPADSPHPAVHIHAWRERASLLKFFADGYSLESVLDTRLSDVLDVFLSSRVEASLASLSSTIYEGMSETCTPGERPDFGAFLTVLTNTYLEDLLNESFLLCRLFSNASYYASDFVTSEPFALPSMRKTQRYLDTQTEKLTEAATSFLGIASMQAIDSLTDRHKLPDTSDSTALSIVFRGALDTCAGLYASYIAENCDNIFLLLERVLSRIADGHASSITAHPLPILTMLITTVTVLNHNPPSTNVSASMTILSALLAAFERHFLDRSDSHASYIFGPDVQSYLTTFDSLVSALSSASRSLAARDSLAADKDLLASCLTLYSPKGSNALSSILLLFYFQRNWGNLVESPASTPEELAAEDAICALILPFRWRVDQLFARFQLYLTAVATVVDHVAAFLSEQQGDDTCFTPLRMAFVACVRDTVSHYLARPEASDPSGDCAQPCKTGN